MAVELGGILSHYRLVEKIGEGGMGVVYRARDEHLHRDVAIKVLPAGTLTDESARRQFRAEALALSRLHHPNIAVIHDFDTQEGVDFLVMEYVHGETLAQRLARGPLPDEQVSVLASQIASALEDAHENGIVHRDLKPGNILLTHKGQAKVLDFGLAKSLRPVDEHSSADTEAQTKGLVGTPPYMAPEQLRGETADARTDIWSLGAVLYEMSTGQRPFRGDIAPKLTDAILHQAPDTPTDVNTRVSPDLERIILKCLQKDPQNRYQSSKEVIVDLGLLGSPRVSGGVTRHRRQPGWLWRSLVGVAVLGVLFAGYVLVHRLQPPPQAPTGMVMLVVLPFENLSADPEHEYFAAGLTDEITSRLAAVSDLGVISRGSAGEYAKSGRSMREIGERLGVNYALDGTVRWNGRIDVSGRVRVTLQLIRVSDLTHVWSGRYDRMMEDIFEVQSDIAIHVVEQLGITIQAPESSAGDLGPTEHPGAYQAYLRGLHRVRKPGSPEEDLRLAIQMFDRAVELDPDFTLAHAELSMAHSIYYHQGFDRTSERLAMAKRAADRATELAPTSPQAHIALAYYHYWGYKDYERALDELSVAAKSLPNSTEVLEATAWIRRRQGQWDEHLAQVEKLLKLNPLDSSLASNLAETYRVLRRFEDSERYYSRCISLSPDHANCYDMKAKMYRAWHGTTEEARAVLESMPDTHAPDFAFSWFWQEFAARNFRAALDHLSPIVGDRYIGGARKALYSAYVYDALDKPDLAHRAYETAWDILARVLIERPDDHDAHSYSGIALAGLGRKDEAIREGRRAVELYPVSKDAHWGPEQVKLLALIYTKVGEHDAALDEIEYLLSIPSWISVPLLRIDPAWKPLWDHPRFKELERRFESPRAH